MPRRCRPALAGCPPSAPFRTPLGPKRPSTGRARALPTPHDSGRVVLKYHALAAKRQARVPVQKGAAKSAEARGALGGRIRHRNRNPPTDSRSRPRGLTTTDCQTRPQGQGLASASTRRPPKTTPPPRGLRGLTRWRRRRASRRAQARAAPGSNFSRRGTSPTGWASGRRGTDQGTLASRPPSPSRLCSAGSGNLRGARRGSTRSCGAGSR
mmetsp:Transcript_34117/g.103022  ORF Transcript_34117/g.103022 Transcript_34117/m.103022 type:complete len:211 (+) Transcript_34117:267-899(+)